MQTSFRAHLEEEFATRRQLPSQQGRLARWPLGGHGLCGRRCAPRRDGRRRSSGCRSSAGASPRIPPDFNAHKVVRRLLERRREMIESGNGIDWAMAEHLAFGTLLAEGFPVRLSGQDSERGTFSQRHAVLIDQETERRWTPLKHVANDQARFEVINSMLSEEAVLGFEYGYSLAEPNALVTVGGAVRRLRQRRAGRVRSVHLVGRAQVAAHVGPRVPAAARLRGPGAGAFIGASRALPAVVRRGQLAGGERARRPPTTSTSCAASCTASSASR